MFSIAEIEKLLQQRFRGAEITVIDNSASHAGHNAAAAGGGTHFTVRIISNEFIGKNRVARHRAVYQVLQPLFDKGLHALALETKAPGE